MQSTAPTPQPGASHSKQGSAGMQDPQRATIAVDQGRLDPKPKWSDLFAGNRDAEKGWKLKYIPTDDFDVVEYTYSEVRSEVNRWRFTLVGVPMGMRASYAMMERYVENRWSMVSKPEIRLTNSGVFLFSFKSEDDMKLILEKSPSMMGGIHPLILKHWFPGIKLDPRNVESVHLWITLPDLGYQFWSEEMLSRIVSKVGKPLMTDKMTATRTRMSYPRVMVEVSAEKPLKEKVILRGPLGEEHVQPIMYEWKPWQCMYCHKFGHKHGDCQRGKKTIKQWVPKAKIVPTEVAPQEGNVQVGASGASTGQEVATEAQEWTIARRRKGKEVRQEGNTVARHLPEATAEIDNEMTEPSMANQVISEVYEEQGRGMTQRGEGIPFSNG